MDDDIHLRIKRIYASIDDAEETNFDIFEPLIIEKGDTLTIEQDFQGNLSEEELSNSAHSIIHNIANLYGHLKKWASKNDVNASKIDELFNSSYEIKLIQDLSNNDNTDTRPEMAVIPEFPPK